MNMTESKEQFKYDFAWRLRDVAQEANDRLDSKAMNIINFSSLLIPIITGILLLYFGKEFFNPTLHYLWFLSLILLLLSIYFAFKVICLKDQGIINTKNHFGKCEKDEMSKMLESTADDLADWQNKILEAKEGKTLNFRNGSYAFVFALATIAISSLFFIL
jgi:hypothetical protein